MTYYLSVRGNENNARETKMTTETRFAEFVKINNLKIEGIKLVMACKDASRRKQRGGEAGFRNYCREMLEIYGKK